MTSCGSIAAISKENTGEIPDVKMDKKYVNPKAEKSEIISEIIYQNILDICIWKVGGSGTPPAPHHQMIYRVKGKIMLIKLQNQVLFHSIQGTIKFMFLFNDNNVACCTKLSILFRWAMRSLFNMGQLFLSILLCFTLPIIIIEFIEILSGGNHLWKFENGFWL